MMLRQSCLSYELTCAMYGKYNTLWPRCNGSHFADDMTKCEKYFDWNVFVPRNQNDIKTMVQITVWQWAGRDTDMAKNT